MNTKPNGAMSAALHASRRVEKNFEPGLVILGSTLSSAIVQRFLLQLKRQIGKDL
jgi:hypothetical protein